MAASNNSIWWYQMILLQFLQEKFEDTKAAKG
jgi:hypothetical protein